MGGQIQGGIIISLIANWATSGEAGSTSPRDPARKEHFSRKGIVAKAPW